MGAAAEALVENVTCHICEGELVWKVLQNVTGPHLSWPAVLPHRKEPKANPGSDGKKDIISGLGSVSGHEEDSLYAKVYNKDGTEIDLTKNSLPSGGKYEKVNIVV